MMKADWKRINLQNDDCDRKEKEGEEDGEEEEGSDHDGYQRKRSTSGAVSEEQGAPAWSMYIQMSNEDRLALLRREKLQKLLCFLPEDRY
jgi:hypothetical protein